MKLLGCRQQSGDSPLSFGSDDSDFSHKDLQLFNAFCEVLSSIGGSIHM